MILPSSLSGSSTSPASNSLFTFSSPKIVSSWSFSAYSAAAAYSASVFGKTLFAVGDTPNLSIFSSAVSSLTKSLYMKGLYSVYIKSFK